MPAKTAPDDSIGFLISDVARLLRRNFDRRLQSLRLTQTQWRAILRLSHTEGMTQVALAESLEIAPISLTRLIDRMEAAGWVERREHPGDRRALQLHLTPKSAPILEEMHARAAETLADAFDGMSVSAQKELLGDLRQVKQNLLAAESEPAAPETTARTTKDVRRNSAARAR